MLEELVLIDVYIIEYLESIILLFYYISAVLAEILGLYFTWFLGFARHEFHL